MIKKVMSLALVVGLAVTMVSFVEASPLSNQLKNQQNQLDQDKNALKQTQDKREELIQAVERLDFQIESIMREIDTTKIQINKSQQDIKKAEKDVEKAEEDIKEEQELFNQRVRAMYVNGNTGYLDVLLDSKGLGDFLSNIENVKKIMEFDKNMIENLNNKRNTLQNKKEALDMENKKLLTLKASKEEKLNSFNNKKEEQEKLIKEVAKEEAIYAAKAKESQKQVNGTLRQIEEMKENLRKAEAARIAAEKAAAKAATSKTTTTKSSPSKVTADFSSNAVVAFASNYLGTPYVWGGNNPKPGFDCSGYTKYVYANFGISIGRTTYDQITNGVAVSRDNLQSGDLVFFGSPSSPHHVGIYVGNNCYIHAPQTGDVIKVSVMDRRDYAGARRVR